MEKPLQSMLDVSSTMLITLYARGGWYNLFSFIEALRKAQWTVHYRIGD